MVLAREPGAGDGKRRSDRKAGRCAILGTAEAIQLSQRTRIFTIQQMLRDRVSVSNRIYEPALIGPEVLRRIGV
jgi:hypothetical protein